MATYPNHASVEVIYHLESDVPFESFLPSRIKVPLRADSAELDPSLSHWVSDKKIIEIVEGYLPRPKGYLQSHYHVSCDRAVYDVGACGCSSDPGYCVRVTIGSQHKNDNEGKGAVQEEEESKKRDREDALRGPAEGVQVTIMNNSAVLEIFRVTRQRVENAGTKPVQNANDLLHLMIFFLWGGVRPGMQLTKADLTEDDRLKKLVGEDNAHLLKGPSWEGDEPAPNIEMLRVLQALSEQACRYTGYEMARRVWRHARRLDTIDDQCTIFVDV